MAMSRCKPCWRVLYRIFHLWKTRFLPPSLVAQGLSTSDKALPEVFCAARLVDKLCSAKLMAILLIYMDIFRVL